MFQAPRRFWSQMISAPSYTYLFTERLPGADPALGAFHASGSLYFFGNISKKYGAGISNTWLGRVMLDYWISFAVSLTPNDGKGTNSML
jgi:carboxylesterase type B